MEKSKTIYDGLNESVLAFVPLSATRILDVGCGTGVLGARLREDRERSIVGITYSLQESELASVRLSQVICADLNSFDFSSLGRFDCVILSHILEHLYAPEQLLERLKRVLGPASVVVIALPNVVWWKQRLEFTLGKWRYKDWGTLDRTHFRVFDMQSSEELLRHAGYEIIHIRRDGPFPVPKSIRKLIGPLAARMDRFICKVAPGLFAFQFVYLARVGMRPPV